MDTMDVLDAHRQGERLRRLLERHGYSVASVEVEQGNIQASVALPYGPRRNVLHVAGIQLDPDFELVALGGRLVRLTTTETTILNTLLLRYGRFVTTADLIATIWPDGDLVACKGRLYTHVCTLRRKLSAARDDVSIESGRLGYRLWTEHDAPVDLTTDI
jgi:DNA-binding response OmpR family regulator